MSRLPIKLFVGLFVVALALSTLAGCSNAGASQGQLDIYTDYETGCQYLDHNSAYRALTPRIASDGKSHMGCKDAKP